MDTRTARPAHPRRILAVLAIGLGLIAALVMATPASATTQRTAAPATHSVAAARSVTANRSVAADSSEYCDLHFGGGTVSTDLVRSGTTVTVFTRNTSVPRRVYFDANRITGLGVHPWLGDSGSLGIGESAVPWTALGAGSYAVFPVYTIAMHDGHGNGAVKNCNIR